MTYQPIAAGPAPTTTLPELYDRVAPLDIRSMLGRLWRGKWLIAFTTICAVLLGGYYAFHMVGPRYGATAALQVDLQPTSLPDVADQWTGPGTDPASLNTQIAVLTSHRILGQMVTQLDLLEDPEFNRYLAPQSPFSPNALRSRLRHFLAGTVEVTPDANAMFEKTVQNLRRAMTVTRPADTYLFEITASSRSADKAMHLANTAAALYVADQLQIKDAASQAAEGWLETRVIALRAQLETQETAVTDLIATAQIQQDSRLDILSNDVLAIEQHLEEASIALARLEAQNNATPWQTAAIAQQAALVEDITAQRDRLRRQLSGQSAGLVSLNQMQREADATRALYETFLTRLQQTRLQRGLERPDNQIIAPATTAQYLGPRKVLIVMVSAVIGGLIGLGAVILRATLRTGVHDTKALSIATQTPVFAQTAAAPMRSMRRLWRQLRKRDTSGLTQAIRVIRTRLVLAEGGTTPCVILCTSSIAGEAKSGHSVALAHGLTTAGKSVLLLAADPAESSLSKSIRKHASLSLSDVLAGHASVAEAATKDRHLGFDTLRIGPDDVVLSDQFDALMETLQGDYDHLVIDAPPVLVDPATALWAQGADAVLYCVRWSTTPLSVAQTGLSRLVDAAAPATGLILTKMPTHALAERRGQNSAHSFASA